EAKKEGWKYMKMKVGSDIHADVRRGEIIREEIGNELKLMMDANQKWGVNEAIENMKLLARFNPWWSEQPSSPDDGPGQLIIKQSNQPVRLTAREHCHNRVMLKQRVNSGAIDLCQIDRSSVGGDTHILRIQCMAAKLKIPA